ncbi:MAG: hypothetical protein KF753_24525 [Caldilineaceae bacterium]|nr:hypothetical protein [Caldilineaceae bacterium]
MNGKIRQKAVALILSALIVMTSAVVAFAASGPESATAPGDGWVKIQAGESHWYTFRDEGDNGQIFVEMDVEGSAGFAVYTPAQVAAWQNGQDLDSIGIGNSNNNVSADLLWTGNFNQSGDYYVVVSQGASGTSDYQLRIHGADVWFPMPAAEMTTAVTPARDSAMSTDSSSTPASTDPNALLPGAEAVVSFDYDGKAGQILVSLDSDPDDAVTFSVWTPNEWQMRSLGQDAEPIGRGSANRFVAGDLSWSGNFVESGTYYLIVKNGSAQNANYTVTISGDGVSQ